MNFDFLKNNFVPQQGPKANRSANTDLFALRSNGTQSLSSLNNPTDNFSNYLASNPKVIAPKNTPAPQTSSSSNILNQKPTVNQPAVSPNDAKTAGSNASSNTSTSNNTSPTKNSVPQAQISNKNSDDLKVQDQAPEATSQAVHSDTATNNNEQSENIESTEEGQVNDAVETAAAAKKASAQLRQFFGDIDKISQQNQSVALFAGKTEYLKPEDIAAMLTGNRLVQDAIGTTDLKGFFVQKQALSKWMTKFGFDRDVVGAMQAQNIDVTVPMSFKDILAAFGIDPQQVYSELADFRAKASSFGLMGEAIPSHGGTKKEKNPSAMAQDDTNKLINSSNQLQSSTLGDGGINNQSINSGSAVTGASAVLSSRPTNPSINPSEFGKEGSSSQTAPSMAGVQTFAHFNASVLERTEPKVLREPSSVLPSKPLTFESDADNVGKVVFFTPFPFSGQDRNSEGSQKINAPRSFQKLAIESGLLNDSLQGGMTTITVDTSSLSTSTNVRSEPNLMDEMSRWSFDQNLQPLNNDQKIQLLNAPKIENTQSLQHFSVKDFNSAYGDPLLIASRTSEQQEALQNILSSKELLNNAPLNRSTLVQDAINPITVAPLTSIGETQKDFSQSSSDRSGDREDENKDEVQNLTRPLELHHISKKSLSFGHLENQKLDQATPEIVKNLADKIAQHSANALANGTSRLNLDMSNSELGNIQVSLALQNNQVDLHLNVSDHKVMEMLRANLTNLKESFALQNMRLNQADVNLNFNFNSQQRHQQGNFAQDQELWKKMSSGQKRMNTAPEIQSVSRTRSVNFNPRMIFTGPQTLRTTPGSLAIMV